LAPFGSYVVVIPQARPSKDPLSTGHDQELSDFRWHDPDAETATGSCDASAAVASLALGDSECQGERDDAG
jgi:hypothetical protein